MASIAPIKSGVHNIVEIDIANTLDLHIASTNLVKIADDYAEHITLNYVWAKSKQSADPIMKQAEVFKAINDSNINLQYSAGARNHRYKDINFDIIDLNTYLQPNEIWIRSENKLPEFFVDNKTAASPSAKSRTFFKALNLETNDERVVEYIPPLATEYAVIDSLLSEGEAWRINANGFPLVAKSRDGKGPATYIAYNESTDTERHVVPPSVDYKSLTSVVNEKIEKLPTKFGADNMEDEFLANWYKKFHQAHHKVKEEYKKLIGEDFTVDYFEQFNDSIGVLGRLSEYPDCNTIPMTDITFEVFSEEGRIAIPRTMPPNIFDKLDNDMKFLALDASRTVNSLFRLNITHVIPELATAKQSHKSNLVTDHIHLLRMAASFSTIVGIISDTLGASYRVLNYLTSAENKQTVLSPKITHIIGTHKVQIDLMQNKIETLKKNITSRDVLKSDSTDIHDQG
jgi:hypothetical protein